MTQNEEQLNSTSEQETEDLDSQNEENNDENLDSQNEDADSDKEDVESKNKQLYARASKAEAELKKLRALQEAYKKNPEKNPPVDPFEVTKLVQALKGFEDEQELDIVQRQSKALGIDLASAASHEDTKVLVEHYRAKKQNKEATPEPSSRTQVGEKPYQQWTPQDINTAIDNGQMDKVDEYYKWAKSN